LTYGQSVPVSTKSKRFAHHRGAVLPSFSQKLDKSPSKLLLHRGILQGAPSKDQVIVKFHWPLRIVIERQPVALEFGNSAVEPEANASEARCKDA